MTRRNWQACLYLAHMEHLDIVSSMSRPIPAQYIMGRALALHLFLSGFHVVWSTIRDAYYAV